MKLILKDKKLYLKKHKLELKKKHLFSGKDENGRKGTATTTNQET